MEYNLNKFPGEYSVGLWVKISQTSTTHPWYTILRLTHILNYQNCNKLGDRVIAFFYNSISNYYDFESYSYNNTLLLGKPNEGWYSNLLTHTYEWNYIYSGYSFEE